MAILVRKIAFGKWPHEKCDLDDIKADAIADIRTKSDTLSFWRIDSKDDLTQAMLALASSSLTTNIEKIDVVWIDEQKIEDCHINTKQTEGDTVIDELKNLHVDLTGLTFGSLKIVAEMIATETISRKHYKRFMAKDVKSELVKAYKNDKINKGLCHEKLMSAIEKAAI